MVDSNLSTGIAPLVSVCIQTYQHAAFIAQCIESIVSQQTTFSFEIVIGEDASTDGTREICIQYAEKYPEKIRLFLRRREDVMYVGGNATGRFNFLENLKEAKGIYIAMCEGDDYWTDKNKLQKQINFLEENKEFGICFHKVLEKNTFDENKNKFIPDINSDMVYTSEDYLASNRTATCSMVFEKNKFLPVPDWFYEVPYGDLGIILQVMSNSNNKAYVLNEVMGVYRIHAGGLHGSFHKNTQTLIKAFKMHLTFNRIMQQTLFKHSKARHIIYEKYLETYRQLYNLYRINNSFTERIYAAAQIFYYKLLLRF